MESFVDHVKIYFRSGAGGNGIVHWRREKYADHGGPDGGDGGKGGSIILRGNAQLWTLLDLRYRKYIHAEDGANGAGAKCKGRAGKDIILDVPLGVVIHDDASGEILGEITKDGEMFMLLEGGRGGQGNWHYRSPTNQAPDYAQKGQEAKEMEVVIELKVLADVGLVGFPNAGKSTLLSVVSEAKPKIGAYAFTTLVPNLGIVRYRDHRSFVMADIPGIIEGAHEGKGLGVRFLRHIERNSVLLFLLPADSEDLRHEYDVLLNELAEYNPELLDTPRIVSVSKIDLADEERRNEIAAALHDVPYITFSAVAQLGIDELKDELWAMLTEQQSLSL